MSAQLTPEERDLMLEMISQPVGMQNPQGQLQGRSAMVPILKLAEYRTKDNDVIRAELVVYKNQKAAKLAEALARAQAQQAQIQAQITALNPA